MAGHARRNITWATTFLYFLTIPFLILVLVGNTSINGTLNDIYFFKLDVSHIIPISVENAQLLNSVARSLGLHDFYSVGVWGFCEGYDDEGVTYCSNPEALYWFNPVEILVNELLAGARIALPKQATMILHLIRIGSKIMYAFFVAGIVVNAVLVPASLLASRSRWWSLPLSLCAFISAVLVVVAAIIATVISVAFKVALTAQHELNIDVQIGAHMFAFMWIAAITTLIAFFVHASMGCCCRSRKPLPSLPSSKGSDSSGSASTEKPLPTPSPTPKSSFTLPVFARRRRGIFS